MMADDDFLLGALDRLPALDLVAFQALLSWAGLRDERPGWHRCIQTANALGADPETVAALWGWVRARVPSASTVEPARRTRYVDLLADDAGEACAGTRDTLMAVAVFRTLMPTRGRLGIWGDRP